MDVKVKISSKKHVQKKQSGQSMLEFAFLVPILMGFFLILVHVEEAMVTAITNQKYARSQLHFLFFNHRYYPEWHFLEKEKFFGRFWVGVSDRSHFGDADPKPLAPTRNISFFLDKKKLPEDEQPQSEYVPDGGGLNRRKNVRVRVVAFTCIPPLALNSNSLFTEGNLGENTFVSGSFPYCQQ